MIEEKLKEFVESFLLLGRCLGECEVEKEVNNGLYTRVLLGVGLITTSE